MVWCQWVRAKRFLNLSGTGFKDEQRDPLTKLASLPLPFDHRHYLLDNARQS